jgi:hypothetical protein
VYVERGDKRTFAGAIDWPGWCRSGKDEGSALQALFDYGPRYARAVRGARLDFSPPGRLSDLRVVERLKGSTTTDFGAPDAAPRRDRDTVLESDLRLYEVLLRAIWGEFDAAARAGKGKVLRTGPRGGGRTLEQMIAHVEEADAAYLGSLGAPYRSAESPGGRSQLVALREAILAGLQSAAHGEIPAKGPRGGRRWTPRYFVRRVTWHVLDHAWEIEDRLG